MELTEVTWRCAVGWAGPEHLLAAGVLPSNTVSVLYQQQYVCVAAAVVHGVG